MPDVQNLTSLFRLNIYNRLSKIAAYTMWRALETSSLFVLWMALFMKSALGLSLWLTFYSCCTGEKVLGTGAWGAFERRLAFNGISKASRNVCTQRSGSAQYSWGWKYDQFSRFESAHINLSGPDFQLTVVLSVCQQSWLTVNGSWLFPGFTEFDWSQGCLQSCGGPWTLLMCTKQLSIVYKVVFSLAVLTAPIPSAPCLSVSLSSCSPGPWHGSATLQPPEYKLAD